MLEPASVRRILVRANNWIGDVVMISPAIRALRERFTGAEIAILARPWVCDALAANPYFDRLIPYEVPGKHSGLTGRLRLVAQIRKERFDLAVLFQKAFDAAFLAAAAGIPERVGHATDARSFLLTHAIPPTATSTLKHHVDFFLEVAEACGCVPSSRVPFFALSDEDRTWADAFLRGEPLPEDRRAPGGLPERSSPREAADERERVRARPAAVSLEASRRAPLPFLAIHPGGSKAPRAWHVDRFVELARRIERRHGLHPVVVGDGSDAEAGAAIASAVRGTLIAAGRSTVRQMGAVIERAALFVGNDSGPMHIAGAVGTPGVGIFGPGRPEKTGPRTAEGRFETVSLRFACSPCRQDFFKECKPSPAGKPYCLEDLAVDLVDAACERVLGAPGLVARPSP